MHTIKSKLDQTCREISNEILPHGSGINGNWSWKITSKQVTFSNCYEAMNESGYYCHTVDFRVIVPVEKVSNVTINLRFDQFKVVGNFSQSSCSCLYDLKSYIEETLDYAFESTSKYNYVVDLDERGEFSAHVEDCLGNEVFSMSTETNDVDEGGLYMVQDGWMKHGRDVDGLTKYLVLMNIIASDSTVTIK